MTKHPLRHDEAQARPVLPAGPPSGGMSRTVKVGMAMAVGVTLVALWTFLPVSEWIENFRTWVAGQGIWGHVVFIAAYVLATVILAPAGLLTLAAGVAFGFWAVPTVLIGATIGLGLAFLIGRYVARDWVAKQASNSKTFTALDRAIESEGWKIVGLMRLSPLVPFGLQNYLFGITSIKFWPYLFTSAVGIIPGTVLYVWIGSLGASAGSELGDATGDADFYKLIALGVGLIATLAVTVIVSRKAQQKLTEIGVAEGSTPAETTPHSAP